MIALVVAGLLVGLIIGRRFTVFALLPVEIAALLLATCAVAMGHAGWMAAILGFASFALSSQTSFAVALAFPTRRRDRARTLA